MTLENKTTEASGSSREQRQEPRRPLPAYSQLGLWLFFVYLMFYVGFVLISAFACEWFEVVLPGGLNLAIVYGFGLIILALLLAMIYGVGSRSSKE